MVHMPVLVLNQNYLPMNICSARRAVVLILREKAEMVSDGNGFIHTPLLKLPLPSVIRLLFMARLPRLQRKLTRFEVFNRDHLTCQYCGRETREMTLDHVIPRSRGGEHCWENIVSACIPCNHRKAGRTPQEAGMRLIHLPRTPPAYFLVPYYHLKNHPAWLEFLPH